jgi:succinoglycan biosynthesis transport protein ExoP
VTIQQFFLALRYRWRTGLIVWIATLLVVLLIGTLLMPNRYRATSELLIEENNLDAIAGVPLPGSNLPSRIMTEADVVRSARVVSGALQALGPSVEQKLRERWQKQTSGRGDFQAWAVEEMQRTIEVRPSRDSRVLQVSHTSRDPALAAAFINALVKAYVETAVDLRLEPARQYNVFFDDRAKQLRDRLHEAQQRASQFERRNGITTTDEKLDVEDARLIDLSAQVVALQAKAGEAQRRRDEAAGSPNSMEEVLKDATVAELARALAVQETRQNELLERFGERHPLVIESKAVTASIAQRLELAKQRVAKALEGGSNVLASHLTERTQALQQQREKVLQRKALRDEARLLQNEVDVARRAFDAVIERLNKTTLEKSAPQVNVSVLEAASVPLLASTASLASKASTGAAIGVLLALIAIVFTEMRDRRVRSSHDVLSAIGQPVLTVLRQRKPRGTVPAVRPLLFRRGPALTSE